MSKKQGVKRGSVAKAEDLIHQIESLIGLFNRLYAENDFTLLRLTTEAGSVSEKLKAYEFGVQFSQDCTMVAMHEGEGWGADRQKRFYTEYCKVYPELRKKAIADYADDKDMDYFWDELEARLKAACGKYFEPKEKRYHIQVTYDNRPFAHMEYTDIVDMFRLNHRGVKEARHGEQSD